MSEVPNVSLVMRELTGLSSQVDSLLRHTDAKVGPTDPRAIRQQIQSFERIGNGSRQERHRQLMERMKGSIGETKALLSGSSQVPESYVFPQPSTRNYGLSATSNSGFVMPKIKYRHLGESSCKRPETPSVLRNTRGTLQHEFYEAEQKRQHGTQFDDQEPLEPSATVDKFGKSGKVNYEQEQLTHEDVLQRYYDICTRRRRKVTENLTDNYESKAGPSRFTRMRQPSNEAGIDRAMRTLLDRR